MPKGVYIHHKGQGGRKGRTGVYIRTSETRLALSIALTGRLFTAEHRAAISESHKNSPAVLKHLRDIQSKLPRGPAHWRWRGGDDNTRSLNQKRYILERDAPGSHSNEEWQELKARCNNRCLACDRKEPDIILTEDHIVPLSRGGSNDIENIQPLCQSCNSKKRIQIINYLHAA